MEYEETKEILAEKLRVALAKCKWKAAHLSRATGFRSGIISRWLTGKQMIGVSDALIVARVLDLPFDWLADPERTGEPPLSDWHGIQGGTKPPNPEPIAPSSPEPKPQDTPVGNGHRRPSGKDGLGKRPPRLK